MRLRKVGVAMFKVIVKKEKEVIFSHFFNTKEEANKFAKGLEELGMIPLFYSSTEIIEVGTIFHPTPNEKFVNICEDENGIFAIIQR